MAAKRRVTIAEAALDLDVSKAEIAFLIECGSMVACQEPAFRGRVWINGDTTADPKRRTRASAELPKEKTPRAKLVEAPVKAMAEPQVATPAESADQPAQTTTGGPTGASAKAPDRSASGQLEQLKEAVVLLLKNQEMQESQLSKLRTELESSRQEVHHLAVAFDQTGVAARPSQIEEPTQAPVKQSGAAQFWQHETLDSAAGQSKQTKSARSWQRKSAEEKEASLEPSSIRLESQQVETQEPESPEPTEARESRRSFRSATMPLAQILAAVFDVRIGKFLGRAWLRFSPPLLS